MTSTALYYVPTIPDIWSTAEYQHCLAVIEAVERSIVLSHARLPTALRQQASETHHLDSGRFVDKVREASRIAIEMCSSGDVCVSSFHYEAACSGFLASRKGAHWVPDIYDTPEQYRMNRPRSHHQLSARGLSLLLNRAETAVSVFLPGAPYQYGPDQRFVPNGAPVSKIDPEHHERTTTRLVWVGSPRLDKGGEILIRALDETDADVTVDIYGRTDERVVTLAESLDVDDMVSFNGQVPYTKALRAVRDADIGYSVLPPRTDWRFAMPLKVGDYLAGATVPLVSDFPGTRYMCSVAGLYAAPTPTAVAEQLDRFTTMGTATRRRYAERARERAEEIPWEDVRRRFAQAAGLGSPS